MSRPIQFAHLPGRPAYEVEGEVEAEPEHHADCECEQCAAMVPAAEWRAHADEVEEREPPFDARKDLGVRGRL